MKRFLLLLCLGLSLVASAQKKLPPYVFDFSNPSSLIPSVIPGHEPGDEVGLNDSIFTSADGMLAMSFTHKNNGSGSYLTTGYDNDYYLFTARSSSFIFDAYGDVEIDSIIFSPNSISGGLLVAEPSNVGQMGVFANWYNRSSVAVKHIRYENTSTTQPEIRIINIYCSLPQDVLFPIKIIPAANSEIHSFSEFILEYAQEVKLSDDAKFELDSDVLGFKSPKLVASVDNNNKKRVIVSLPEDSDPITALGHYELTISDKSIIATDEDGFWNKKVTYAFDIVESFATFDMLAVVPDTGVVEEIPNTIILKFPDMVKHISDEILELKDYNGDVVRELSADFDQDDADYTSVKLKFNEPFVNPVKKAGIYRLMIPEKFIWNNKYKASEPDSGIVNGARFNPEILLEWNVGNQQYASAEKLEEAKKWLEYVGPGYPDAESTSRKVLQRMVELEIGSDEKFNDSIAAYIMEKQIELPQTGKWYRIEGVSSNDGKVYLASRNDSIVLTKELKEAASFKATLNEDSTVVFMTMDSLYLHQLQSQDIYKGTTKRNATMKYDAEVNNLILEHLNIEGVDSLQSFGKMTIFGSLGKNLNDEEKKAYALVDVVKGSVETNWEYAPKYEEALTSAFRIVQTDKPIPVLNYAIDPIPGSEIDTLQYVKVKFLTDSLVTIAEDALATDLVGQSNLIHSTSIEPVEEEANTFRIRFDDVPAGKSTVTIPKGTFLFVDEGRTLPAEEMTAVYQVKNSMDIQYDLLDIMPFYIIGANQGMKWFRDVDLGNLIIHTNRPYVFGISDKKVNIVQILTGREEVVLTGHFENIINFAEPGYEGCGAMHLVLDKEIKEGDIEPGQYLFDIFEGTYGDVNFAKYLADPMSVSKKQCHANSFFFLDIMIDNEKATAGIRHISIDDQADKVYDLMGRRIGSDVKPGIYVKNGKKVVVK